MWVKYGAFLKAGWTGLLEYRGMLLMTLCFSWLPLIPLMVWLTILDDTTSIAGYARDELIAYYLAALVMRQLIIVWIGWTLPVEISQGELSPKLLRPINPIHQDLAGHIAHKLATMPVLLLFVIPAMVLSGATYQLDLVQLGFAIPAIVCAFLITFLSNYVIALLAFWMTKVHSLIDIWYATGMLLSGVMLPIAFYPKDIVPYINYLPFRYMVSFPIEIIMRKIDTAEMMRGSFIMVSWLLCFIILGKLLWRKGLRRYSATGA